MDNWGQGTFTLFVPRLYRRAIGVTTQESLAFAIRLDDFCEPYIQDVMEVNIRQDR